MEEPIAGNAGNAVNIGRKKQSAKRDDDIMATNNSSIVSKRSVERLYFPDEPHFFRYFVKKPQRRSPLINRGYWLRMKAIDNVVQRFLEKPSEKTKIVINLGCGYDPLPWQCLTRYRESCNNVTFVDVDYPSLIAKKCMTVLTTPQLLNMLENTSYTGKTDGVMFQSDQYVQIGCDLRDIPTLSKVLESILNIKDSLILFTAEVSITYMRMPYADNLIEWAGSLPDARFCLLEQILPDGPNHPFAKTMIAHFNKLQTPLHSVELYPTVESQESRFKERGWRIANARNLWELWHSGDFLAYTERMSLDEIEPFDEWEEFALFGEHYFVLIASNNSEPIHYFQNYKVIPPDNTDTIYREVKYTKNLTGQGCRRFGAPLVFISNYPEDDVVANYAGMGLNTRMSSFDIYSSEDKEVGVPTTGPSPRQCHTITDMEDSALLIGGRGSPDHAFSDCWRYNKTKRCFERLKDLPVPRYRHSAIVIFSGSVLVLGGKSDSRTLVQDCLLFDHGGSWRKIPQIGLDDEIPEARYGATLINTSSSQGLLIGGILKDGTLASDIWMWEVKVGFQAPYFVIAFKRADKLAISRASCLARFGASTVEHYGKVYLVGGVARSLLNIETEVIALSVAMPGIDPSLEACPLRLDDGVPRPLLIGVSVAFARSGLLIMGGGAVCFSFGTSWNRGCYTLMDPAPEEPLALWYHKTLKPWKLLEHTGFEIPQRNDASDPIHNSDSVQERSMDGTSFGASIPRVGITNTQDFEQFIRAAQPVILEGLDLGSCTSSWSPEYLKERIGHDRPVIVHEATTRSMDFQAKNFRYTTKPFGEFVDEAERGGKFYLRALSEEKPSGLPTDITRDFPSISSDFRLPPELRFVAENAHSSPLRISGDVAMWLHYDVMANVLCQIYGTKRVVLFPPSDVQYLQFAPGASSSSIDVFSQYNPHSSEAVIDPRTHPHEALLNPGDVLLLPALWIHAAAPTGGFSVAVNVFFRNLESGYAAGRDVYGNRDLAAYEKGRLDVAKIAKAFDKVPPDMREFYLTRLADELRGMASGG